MPLPFTHSDSKHETRSNWRAKNWRKKSARSRRKFFFTSSGTEADNLALKGVVLSTLGERFKSSRQSWSTRRFWKRSSGFKKKFSVAVDYVEHDAHGRLDLDDLKQKIRPNCLNLISIMHANNELGNINPIKQLLKLPNPTTPFFTLTRFKAQAS